jgi:hypothetical protein
MRMVFRFCAAARQSGEARAGARRCGRGAAILFCSAGAAACGPTYLIPKEDYRLALERPEPAPVLLAIRKSDGNIVGVRWNSIRPVDANQIAPDDVPPQTTAFVTVRGRGAQHPLWKAGAILSISSAVSILVGPSLLGAARFGRDGSAGGERLFFSGLAISILSAPLFATGVPLWITGGVRGRPQEVPL